MPCDVLPVTIFTGSPFIFRASRQAGSAKGLLSHFSFLSFRNLSGSPARSPFSFYRDRSIYISHLFLHVNKAQTIFCFYRKNCERCHSLLSWIEVWSQTNRQTGRHWQVLGCLRQSLDSQKGPFISLFLLLCLSVFLEILFPLSLQFLA